MLLEMLLRFEIYIGSEVMSKILVISEHYQFPDSPDTNCMKCILDGIIEEGNDVTLFTPIYRGQKKRNEKFKVRYFYQNSQEIIDNRFGFKKKNFFISIILNFLSFFYLKLSGYRTRKEYLKEFERINAEEGTFDCILSFYCPKKSHDIANYIVSKHRGLKWFLYFFDPHTFNTDYKNSIKVGTVFTRAFDEVRWSKHAYGIICSYGILEENERRNFYPYRGKKSLEVHLPNLRLNDVDGVSSRKEGEKIRMVFTGKFYQDIRNPDPLIDVLFKINQNIACVEFYGECCQYLKEHYENLPDCVKLMGRVSQEECKKITENADILINVGNTTANQVPSKIFEYIASGKPIISFFSVENDTSLFYLNKYPVIYKVFTGSKCNINSLEEFIKNSGTVSSSTLHEIYGDCLSENIVKKVVDFLKL